MPPDGELIMPTISEHEGLFWMVDSSGRRLIDRQEAIGLLYTAQAECDCSVVDRVMLAAEVAGQRDKRRNTN
jgi:hypothetical protein